jgi:hypothetical protein
LGYFPNKISRKDQLTSDPYCPPGTHHIRDGRIEIDNNAAEQLRGVALGRKNYLFAGSDASGERVAAIDSLTGPAKLNGPGFRSLSARCAPALPIIPSIASRNCSGFDIPRLLCDDNFTQGQLGSPKLALPSHSSPHS